MKVLRFALLLLVIIGAYFLGLRAGIVEPNEQNDEAWHSVEHRNEGSICFNALEDGTTRILIAPQTQRIGPTCGEIIRTSASFVVNQEDFEIKASSFFALRFRSSPSCVITNPGGYPTIIDSLGHIEPGAYEIHHGPVHLGTIQLPTAATRLDEYGQCLRPPPSNPAGE